MSDSISQIEILIEIEIVVEHVDAVTLFDFDNDFDYDFDPEKDFSATIKASINDIVSKAENTPFNQAQPSTALLTIVRAICIFHLFLSPGRVLASATAASPAAAAFFSLMDFPLIKFSDVNTR